MTRASELKYRPIKWLWPGRIAHAKLTLLTGAPGSGKSALVASIIAAVTTGGAYPCGEGKAPHGSVILVSPEGDPDVLIPRLKAAGADLARVEIITRVPGPKGPRPFDIAHDMPLLDAAVRAVTDLRVVMFDALIPAAGRAATQATRALLDPLAALAQAHEIAMLAVLQPGTDRGARKAAPFDTLALEAARTAFSIAIDPADEKRRLLLQNKNDLAPERGTPAFRITGREIEPGQSAARLEFEQQYNPLSAHEFMARQGRSFNSERAEAIEFLRGLLGSAAQLQIRQVEQEARASGLLGANQQLSKCRVLSDARMAMGLAMTREGPNSSVWVWAKPGAQTPAVASPPLQPGQTKQMQIA
jgi:putative DNA primase/helicase